MQKFIEVGTDAFFSFRVWTELVKLGDASADAVTGPMTVKQVSQWTPLSMMLVMTDLYACTAGKTVCVPYCCNYFVVIVIIIIIIIVVISFPYRSIFITSHHHLHSYRYFLS